MASLREQIWAALDDEFRSSADIAQRAGVAATSAAPALGLMRQHGRVESRLEGTRTLWRRRSTNAGARTVQQIADLFSVPGVHGHRGRPG